jgi:glycolate oxidase
MSLLFVEDDLSLMRAVREVWNPKGLLNPAKVLPTGAKCGETRALPSVAAAAGAWI